MWMYHSEFNFYSQDRDTTDSVGLYIVISSIVLTGDKNILVQCHLSAGKCRKPDLFNISAQKTLLVFTCCEVIGFHFIHSVWSPRHLLVLVVWCIWWIGGSYWPDGIVLVCLFGRKWAAVSLYKYQLTKQGNSTSQGGQNTSVTGRIYL